MKCSTQNLFGFSDSFLYPRARERVNMFRIDWKNIIETAKFLAEIMLLGKRPHSSSTMPCIRLGISYALSKPSVHEIPRTINSDPKGFNFCNKSTHSSRMGMHARHSFSAMCRSSVV